MAAAVRLRGDYDGDRLRRLAKRSEDADQTRRLLALAAIYDGGSRTAAARIGGVGLQTVRDWVLAFNGEGPPGLVNGKAPGNPPLLSEVQRQALMKIVEQVCARASAGFMTRTFSTSPARSSFARARGRVHRQGQGGDALGVRRQGIGHHDQRQAPAGGQFVLHAKALPGNPYDGHTLKDVIEDAEALTGREIERIYVDKGYRGQCRQALTRLHLTPKRGASAPSSASSATQRRRAGDRPYEKRWTSWPELSQGPQRRCRQCHPLRHRI